MGASMFLGSRYDPQVFYRVVFTFIKQEGGGIRILFHEYATGNRGSAFEHNNEVMGSWKNVQSKLDAFKISIESDPASEAK